MSVVRKHHNKNYTVMSNYHFMDKELSLKAKGLLSLMLSLPDNWDYSTKGLETLSKDGNTSVRSALNELEEHSYLIRERVFENGKIVDWEYHIFENQEDCQQFKNLHVENAHVEINNNKVNKESNTKKENTKNNSKELLQNSNFNFGKQKSKKENLFTKCVSLIDTYDFSRREEIRKLLIEYLQFRLSVKDKPLYINMWKGMLNKLCGLCENDIYLYEKVIKQSIERGYLSFYPVNDFNNSLDKPWEEGVKSDGYTDEEKRELEKREQEMIARGERVWY